MTEDLLEMLPQILYSQPLQKKKLCKQFHVGSAKAIYSQSHGQVTASFFGYGPL